MVEIKTRAKKVRVKTAKGRKVGSTAWLKRHINDPYVIMAKENQYRSRAAFKLLEMNTKYHLFEGAKYVVDLGAAPGSWSQALKKHANCKFIIGIDIQEMEPIEGVELVHGDFLDEKTQIILESFLGGNKIDLVVSDMAANSCGDRITDHLRLVNLVEAAIEFSRRNLNIGGNFVAKMLRGECESDLIKELKKDFKEVHLFKPKASYQSSSEIYLLACGFKPDR
jgi:23S rRNA (uridine2552-2'-O)-methyltransferase